MTIEQILSEFDKRFDYLNARHTNEQWDEYKDLLTSSLTSFGKQEYERGRGESKELLENIAQSFSRLNLDYWQHDAENKCLYKGAVTEIDRLLKEAKAESV